MRREVQPDRFDLLLADKREELVLGNVGHEGATFGKCLVDLFLEALIAIDPAIHSRSRNTDFLASSLDGRGTLELLKERLLEFVLANCDRIFSTHTALP